MRCAICFPASLRAGSRAETARRIFGRWLSFTRICSADAALPETDWDIAGAKAQPEPYTVGPLIVVLEIGAVIPTEVEAEDAVSHGRHLAAGTHGRRITSVCAKHVAHGIRPIVVGSGRNRPAA